MLLLIGSAVVGTLILILSAIDGLFAPEPGEMWRDVRLAFGACVVLAVACFALLEIDRRATAARGGPRPPVARRHPHAPDATPAPDRNDSQACT